MAEKRHSDRLEDRIVTELGRRGLVRRESRLRGGAATAMMAALLVAVTALTTSLVLGGGSADQAQPNYMLVLYTTDEYVPEGAAAGPARANEYAEWAHDRSTREHAIVGGAELTGRLAVAGRPAESDAELAGYFLVRARSREDAIALARSSPHLRYGGTVAVYEVAG